jgi:predicted NAD-dependent protein-ADP-ribosyltransferase YbiA (DUF1768 family)
MEQPPANAGFGFLMAVGLIVTVALVFGVLVPFSKRDHGKRDYRKHNNIVLDDSAPSLPSTSTREFDDLQLYPKPRQLLFADPRPNAYYAHHEIGICAFYDRHTQGPYDDLEGICGCGFLCNSFGSALDLEVDGKPMTFTNAEAAFQALRFSKYARQFENLSGEEALQLAKDFAGQGFQDPEHGGYGTSWQAMHAVLKAKFNVNTPLGLALEKTGDDFLLCHSSDHDPFSVWSNGANGQGTNWLGMQLMLIRSNRTGWKRWTTFIQSQVDTFTGQPVYDCKDNPFQDAVKRASETLKTGLTHRQDALPSISQQPATIAATSVVAESGRAGQERELMLLARTPEGQEQDALTGYDQFQELQASSPEALILPAQADSVCLACGGEGIDFMGHPCDACPGAEVLQQEADLLELQQKQ